MILRMLEAPKGQLVTVEELKQFARIDHNYDDELLATLIAAAEESAEDYQRRAYLKRKYELRKIMPIALAGCIKISLPRSDTLDIVGSVQVVTGETATDVDFRVIKDLVSKVVIPDVRAGSVKIVYTTGCEDVASLVGMDRVKLAIKQMAAHWYENRQAVSSTNTSPREMPMGVKYLLNPGRILL